MSTANITMNVFIESTLNGSAAGHLELNTSITETVDSLISTFCIEKGIRYKQQYVLKNQDNVVLDSMKTLENNGINEGDVLFLTTKNEEHKILGFNNWWILCGMATMIGLVGLLVVSLIYAMPGPIPPNYGIVFDAGSTHTNMFLYSWTAPKQNGTGNVTQISTCTVNGSGIATYASNPKKAGEILKACLDEAYSHIPHNEKKDSPVFLGATAGMRILNETNSTLASDIMTSIDNTLAQSGFKYHSNHSRIISGQEEGIGGWITANFLYKRLGNAKHFSSVDTYGALDLGGASTQISFIPRSNETISKTDDFVTLKLYGAQYNVFSNSYLCFGQVEFERRFQAELISDSYNKQSTLVIDNPCGLKGGNQTLHLSDIFNKICTMQWTNNSIPLNTTVNFTGTGDAKKCQERVQRIVNVTECAQRNYSHCLNFSNKPLVKGKFVAFSTFYYTINYFNLTKNLSLDSFSKAITTFCSEPSSKILDSHAKKYCLTGHYILNMLNLTYKFHDWNNIIVADSVNGVDLGWSLGFMTRATNVIPLEDPEKMLSVASFSVLLLLFIVFLIAGAAFAYHACFRSRRITSYQRLSQYGAI